MTPKGFVSTPKVVDKKRIYFFLCVGVSFVFLFLLWIFIITKPVQSSLEKSLSGHFEFSSTKLEKKEFDFRDFSWHVETISELKNIPKSFLSFKTMRIKARKNILGYISIEKAILQVDSKNHFLRGGVEFNKNLWGWNFDLTNLEIKIGSFQKIIGVPSFLSLNYITKDNLEGILRYNNLSLDIRFLKKSKDILIVEFPQQLMKVSKQKIPFGIFSDLETTGVWSFASRLELNGENIKDNSVLSGTQILLNMSSLQSDFLQSPRGIGVLDVNIQSRENGLQGKLKADLTKAVFEMNDHRFFKNEGLELMIDCDLKDDFVSGNTRLGEARIDFDFNTKGQFKAQLVSLPLELLPKIRSFPMSQGGRLNGKLEAFFVKNTLGSWDLDRWKVQSRKANISWDGSYEFLPGFKVKGVSSYKGSVDLGLDSIKNSHINLMGEWNLSQAQVQFQDYFYKKKGEPFLLKASYEKKNSKILNFEGSAEGKKNFVKFTMPQENYLKLQFPQVFTSPKGSLTGTVLFKLCEESRTQDCFSEVHSYDLRVNDWDYVFLNQERGYKFSGDVKKTPKEIVYKNLRVQLSDHSSLKVDAVFNENQKTKDVVHLDAFLDLNTFRDANFGELFKILKNKKTDIFLKLSFADKEKKLNFSTDAQFSEKKLKLSNWILNDEKLQFEGQGEVYLENYILRNEPVSFTASAEGKGVLEGFDFLSTKAPFEGKVFLASSGYSISEWLQKIEARFHGKVSFENFAINRLLGEVFSSYASEVKNSFAQSLQSCVPHKIRGKIDLSYAQGKWELSQSLFKDQDNGSLLKLSGPLQDFKMIGLQAHYLPSSQCSPILSSCLGELLPKGGVALDLIGSLKDPETDFDFKSMTEILDKCAKKDEARKLALRPKVKAEDQARRLRSLKNFYQSR